MSTPNAARMNLERRRNLVDNIVRRLRAELPQPFWREDHSLLQPDVLPDRPHSVERFFLPVRAPVGPRDLTGIDRKANGVDGFDEIGGRAPWVTKVSSAPSGKGMPSPAGMSAEQTPDETSRMSVQCCRS